MQFLSLKHFRAGLVSSPWGKNTQGVLVLQDLGTLPGVQPRCGRAATSAFGSGQYKYKTWIQMGSLYRKYHLSRHWGDGHLSTGGLPMAFSSHQGRRRGRHRRSPGAAIQGGFHPTAAPTHPKRVFPGWMVLFLGGVTDPMGAAVSLGCLGAGFGQEGGA